MVRGLDRVAKPPPELANNIVDQAGDFPISLNEAKQLRLGLMDERTAYVDEVNEEFERDTFSFCK